MATPNRSRMESADDDPYGDTMNRPSWAGLPDERDRALSNGRSLQCTSIDVQIIDTSTIRSHTQYKIQLSSGGKNWTVNRRFKDFYYLDKQLRMNYPNINLPSLPPKRYILSSTDPRFVEERRAQLETYLRSLVTNSHVWSYNDLVLFLDDETNSMMFIWNFERMRNIRDMLSSMTLKADGSTELNQEFDLAKEQLSILQERLSRMEMLFLQQATGMASERLSDSVIRTLSGNLSTALSSKLAEELREEEKAEGGMYDTQSTGARDNVMQAAVEKLDLGSLASTGAGSGASDGLATDALNDIEIENAVQAHLASGLPMSADEVVKVLMLTREEDTEKTKAQIGNWRAKSTEEVRAVAVSLKLQEAMKMSNDLLDDKMDIQTSKVHKSPSRSSLSNITPRNASPADSSVISPSKLTRRVKIGSVQPELDLFNATGALPSAPWIDPLFSTVDDLVQALSPTESALLKRRHVFEYIRGIVCSTLALQLFPTGSTVSHTFLPDSDFDTTTFFVPKTGNTLDNWFVKLNEALCMSAFSQQSEATAAAAAGCSSLVDSLAATDGKVTISNVSFVNSDVKIIKSSINNIPVAISANHVESLYAQSFIERIDEIVGQHHLFKRSVLLIKAWCQYESSKLNGASGCVAGNASDSFLTSWSAVVMLTYVFNTAGDLIKHPLQALGYFLKTYSSFDWDNYALSVRGPISLGKIHQVIAEAGKPVIDAAAATTATAAATTAAATATAAETVVEPAAPSMDNSDDAFNVDRAATASASAAPAPSRRGPTVQPYNIGNINCGDGSGNNYFSDEQLTFVSPCFQEYKKHTEALAAAAVAAEAAAALAAAEAAALLSPDEVAAAAATAASSDKPVGGKSSEKSAYVPKYNNNHSGSSYFNRSSSVFWSAQGALVQNTRRNASSLRGEDAPTPPGQYCVSYMNIVDPVTANCNLAKRVEEHELDSIISSFREGYTHFQEMCLSASSTSSVGDSSASSKAVKSLLLNTSIRCGAALVTIRNQKSAAGGALLQQQLPQVDVFVSQRNQLEYSLKYAELVLGGKISRSVLTQLIVQILHKKGSMPVGEVGKNLQLITNSETISRRLKEQYNGLKKAIEVSNSAQLNMGTDHPFNPTVSLTPLATTITGALDSASPSNTPAGGGDNFAKRVVVDETVTVGAAMPTFAHVDFVYSPVAAAASSVAASAAPKSSAPNLAATASGVPLSQGALAQHTAVVGSTAGDVVSSTTASSTTGSVKSSAVSNFSYRRQPPYFMDRQMNRYQYQQQHQQKAAYSPGGRRNMHQQQQQQQHGFFQGHPQPPPGTMIYGPQYPPMPSMPMGVSPEMFQQQMHMQYMQQKQLYDSYQAQMMMATPTFSGLSLSSSPSAAAISVSPATASFMTGLLQEDSGSTPPPIGNIMFYQQMVQQQQQQQPHQQQPAQRGGAAQVAAPSTGTASAAEEITTPPPPASSSDA